uniref:NADH-ubiquinone oxidoreductase chain 6 n=1 Tax=Saccopharynx lavenbergi TaxID=136490 RepID=Q76MH1_9TELE|nr:NADH dehydrogenase subunits 6 [Saccopharynx lavenbergi]
MNLLNYSLLAVLLLGVLGVSSNPAVYYAALSLVLAAAGGCGIVGILGGSFMSLVLLLIYLGGMLVVFVYSVALTADPHPESWVGWDVAGRVGGYIFVSILGVAVFCATTPLGYNGVVGESHGLLFLSGGFCGVSLIYCWGLLLFICGWGLLLTLFVVYELIRGKGRGTLRMIGE